MDPKFTAFTLRFRGIGGQLITDVTITRPASGTITALSETVKGLWDTGATHTSLSDRLIGRLGLTSVRPVKQETASGTRMANGYVVDINLPNNVSYSTVFVNDSSLPQHFDVLIGMDIITSGDFSLTHVGGNTVFSFRHPSMAAVDFVQEHSKKVFAGTPRNAPCPCNNGKKFKQCHGASG